MPLGSSEAGGAIGDHSACATHPRVPMISTRLATTDCGRSYHAAHVDGPCYTPVHARACGARTRVTPPMVTHAQPAREGQTVISDRGARLSTCACTSTPLYTWSSTLTCTLADGYLCTHLLHTLIHIHTHNAPMYTHMYTQCTHMLYTFGHTNLYTRLHTHVHANVNTVVYANIYPHVAPINLTHVYTHVLYTCLVHMSCTHVLHTCAPISRTTLLPAPHRAARTCCSTCLHTCLYTCLAHMSTHMSAWLYAHTCTSLHWTG